MISTVFPSAPTYGRACAVQPPYSVKLFPHPPFHWNYDYDVLQLVCVLHIHCSTVSCPVKGTGTIRSGPGLNVHWLIKDMLRRGYKDRVCAKTGTLCGLLVCSTVLLVYICVVYVFCHHTQLDVCHKW